MNSDVNTNCDTYLARSLAAEDLRRGDFVSILSEIVEWPSFFWSCDPQLLPPCEPVRISSRPNDCGRPLKVKQICLPFVFAKLPCGQHQILDVRKHRLVRLSEEYARSVWKTMSKQATPKCGQPR